MRPEGSVLMDNVSPVTVYNGTTLCTQCNLLLTPVEVLWGKGGLCGDCHAAYVQTLINNAMAPGRTP